MLALLLIGTLALAFNVGLVHAQVAETVYINSDGSVSPSSAPISSVDHVTYTFTGNVSYPTYYGIVVNRSNIIIDGNGYTVQGEGSGRGYGLSLTGVSNVTIKNTNINRFDAAIYLISSSYITISLNNAAANIVGIALYSSSNNSVSENNLTANTYDGIELRSSNNNDVTGNNAIANSYFGIFLDFSSSNYVSGNNATANNDDGINLVGSANNVVSGNIATANSSIAVGIFLDSSSNNTVSGNNATANANVGIGLDYSSYNTISGNNVTANGIGIYLQSSSNNTIYHNDFIRNTAQTSFVSTSVGNTWDDGYPSGGNYWSDYNGTDLKSGPYQNVTGSDGIGDTPYVINANNTDHYPLMNPWIRLIGDVNGDGTVDISDVSIAAAAFGSHPGMPNWNPAADVNGDGVVDIMDIALIASNFGQHYP
jgi:parallel beta-helix repeat protein